MNKCLEALEKLRDRANHDEYLFRKDTSREKALSFLKENDESIETIEKELKDYYALKKECEEAKWYQEHKALKIIKDKKVDVPFIIENPEAENVFWYNSSFTGVLCEGWRMISQEEYDLLREVLL